MDYEKRVHEAMRAIVAAGLAESAHDLSDGGLAVALTESCTPEIGADVGQGFRPAAGLLPGVFLFHEAPSRILISTANPDEIHHIAKTNRVESVLIGVTMNGRLRIHNGGNSIIDLPTAVLKQTFEESFPNLLKNHAV
jgi:phosphoribosylformylglycinamidine synthase